MNRTRVWLAALLLLLSAFGATTLRTQVVAATPSSQEAVVDYLDQIAQRVAQQPGYQKLIRGAHRRVLVKITVTAGGKLDDVTIDLSSGDRAFDKSVLALVRQAQPFGELPRVLVDKGWLVFILTIPISTL